MRRMYELQMWWMWRADRVYDWLEGFGTRGIWLGDNVWDPFHDKVQELLCAAYMHHPIQDHCGMPEHDLCAFCGASTPHRAGRPTPLGGP